MQIVAAGDDEQSTVFPELDHWMIFVAMISLDTYVYLATKYM